MAGTDAGNPSLNQPPGSNPKRGESRRRGLPRMRISEVWVSDPVPISDTQEYHVQVGFIVLVDGHPPHYEVQYQFHVGDRPGERQTVGSDGRVAELLRAKRGDLVWVELMGAGIEPRRIPLREIQEVISEFPARLIVMTTRVSGAHFTVFTACVDQRGIGVQGQVQFVYVDPELDETTPQWRSKETDEYGVASFTVACADTPFMVTAFMPVRPDQRHEIEVPAYRPVASYDELAVLRAQTEVAKARVGLNTELAKLVPPPPTDYRVRTTPEGPSDRYEISVEVFNDAGPVRNWPIEIADPENSDPDSRLLRRTTDSHGSLTFPIQTNERRKLVITLVGAKDCKPCELDLPGPSRHRTPPEIPAAPEEVLDRGFGATFRWFGEQAKLRRAQERRPT